MAKITFGGAEPKDSPLFTGRVIFGGRRLTELTKGKKGAKEETAAGKRSGAAKTGKKPSGERSGS